MAFSPAMKDREAPRAAKPEGLENSGRDNRPAELADVLEMEIIYSDIEWVLFLSFEFPKQRGPTTTLTRDLWVPAEIR